MSGRFVMPVKIQVSVTFGYSHGSAGLLRLVETAHLCLARLGRCVVEAQVRAELEQELRAIDAKWRSQVSEEAKLALGKELKAIDAKWRSQVSEEAKLALGKELKAIDTKWQSRIAEEAKLELARIAKELKRAAERAKGNGRAAQQAALSLCLVFVPGRFGVAILLRTRLLEYSSGDPRPV
ncbi:hypothetical protein GH714_042816 [Hevea brasiliensis]|uniref:Uncharacterized protein n=1 Tax=Hevea brasiliensis TaxID=3981 RepID=A0A6A6JZJ4_HEVBR|nr:hypothetical protein GH714_042816 [Hevea brasiliensis]